MPAVRYYPDHHQYISLPFGTVFVFGSNRRGLHGKGAAQTAVTRFCAKWEKGEGLSGRNGLYSYAIPTKDHDLKILPLEIIKESIDRFVELTHLHPDTDFFLTAVGTGYARRTDSQMARLFQQVGTNCIIPQGWLEFIYPGLSIEECERYDAGLQR